MCVFCEVIVATANANIGAYNLMGFLYEVDLEKNFWHQNWSPE